jgi:hypothetical protein
MACSLAFKRPLLKPTTVYLADNGIFINVGGSLCCVNHVESDDKGVYVFQDGISDVFIGKCLYCGDITIGGYCVNSECKSKR